jgi:hypothetical protein
LAIRHPSSGRRKKEEGRNLCFEWGATQNDFDGGSDVDSTLFNKMSLFILLNDYVAARIWKLVFQRVLDQLKRAGRLGAGWPIRHDEEAWQEWRVNGLLHRDNDKPAVVRYASEHWRLCEWWVNGQRHRDGDRPAIICYDGLAEWWIHGRCYQQENLLSNSPTNWFDWNSWNSTSSLVQVRLDEGKRDLARNQGFDFWLRGSIYDF